MSKAHVTLFVVVPPAIDPEGVDIQPKVTTLGWKFAEQTDSDLIDLIAQVDANVKAQAKWLETARAVLKGRLVEPEEPGKQTVTPGKLFEAHYLKSARTDIDRDAVKKDMGDEWYAAHCKTISVLQLRIVPITQTPVTT